MKYIKYIEYIITPIIFTTLTVIIDLISGDVKRFSSYLLGFVIFGLLYFLVMSLFKKFLKGGAQ